MHSSNLGIRAIAIGLVVGTALCSGPSLQAQTFNGQINGTVSEPSGSVVPGATVKLNSLDTKFERLVTTQERGSYLFPSLPPGRYSLTVTASGFETYVVSEILLNVQQARTVDVELRLGEITQRVEVTASAVALDKTDATVGTIIQQDEVLELPLNGRSVTQLILLTPGTSPRQRPAQGSFTIQLGGGAVFPDVNGIRSDMNNFTFDGMEANSRFRQVTAVVPPPDALSEFRVATHSTDPQIALSAGATVTLVSRSGSDKFHGTLWEFLRNDKLSANGFFNNRNGFDRLPYKQNQYGGFFGGPVIIPKVLNGRNSRTYFSVYDEGFNSRRQAVTSATVPDAAVRRGDFSGLLGARLGTDCLGNPVFDKQIFDPTTTTANANCPNGFVRTAFPNNMIPANRIDPVVTAYMNLFPLPNRSTLPNLQIAQAQKQNANQYGIRIDQYLTDKQSIFGRFNHYIVTDTAPGNVVVNAVKRFNNGYNWTIQYQNVLSSTFLMNYAFGYNSASIPFRTNPLGESWNTAAGPNFSFPIPDKPGLYLPAGVVFTGSNFNGASFSNYDLANPDYSYQNNIGFKKVKGKHDISFGFQLLHVRHKVGVQGAASTSWTAATTGQPGFSSTGDGLASFFTGLPTGSSQGYGNPLLNRTYHQMEYIQDTWKVTPRLVINLGLNYVYAPPPVLKNKPTALTTVEGNYQSLFNYAIALTQPNATNFAYAFQWTDVNPITGEGPNVDSKYMIETEKTDFMPRVGIAYGVRDNTVVRAGFGMFYEYGKIYSSRQFGGWPYNQSTSISGQNLLTPGPFNPPITIDAPYANPVPGNPVPGISFEPKQRYPYAMMWNFGVQHMLPGDTKLDASYVGSGGRHLLSAYRVNLAPASPLPFGPRKPLVNAPVIGFNANDVSSNYHSFQLSLQKRFLGGLTFRQSYTWAHSLDVQTDIDTGISYPYDHRLDYGNSSFDLTHTSVTSFVYELPVGPNKRFAANAPGVLNAIIGGWQFSGIVTLRSGLPYSILTNQDNANVGAVQPFRPNRISPPVPSGFEQNIDHWFDTTAFRVPTFGSLGTEPRNSLRGPAAQIFDLAIMKNFRITEATKLQFRGEFFNAFNHVNFGNPVTTMTSPLFGQILGAQGARDIQLALKLYW